MLSTTHIIYNQHLILQRSFWTCKCEIIGYNLFNLNLFWRIEFEQTFLDKIVYLHYRACNRRRRFIIAISNIVPIKFYLVLSNHSLKRHWLLPLWNLLLFLLLTILIKNRIRWLKKFILILVGYIIFVKHVTISQ